MDVSRTALREARIRQTARVRITLLRHAEPDWVPGGGAAVNDPGLTEHGRRQAEAAAKALAGEGIDALYVSPHRRARETAAPLEALLGREAVVVPDLREFGIHIEGLRPDEVEERFAELSRRPLREHWSGWPGEETFPEFHERATRALHDVLARHVIRPERLDDFTVWHLPEEPVHIGIVAHGGTNAVLLTHLLDIRPVPWEWLRFDAELAAYSVVQARALGERGFVFTLQNFNELDHLRAAGLR